MKFGWHGFAVLSGILAVAALAGMTLFTWLALLGLERFRVRRLERGEAGLLGADIATMPYDVFAKLVKHPLTDLGLEKFLADWRKLHGGDDQQP